MQVNEDLCTGCGACVEICPNEAIQLSEGFPVFDEVACTQCQSCVDACPVNAITTIEQPAAVTKPAVVQTEHTAETTVEEPVSSSPKPWLNTVLAFTRQEILPRLADTLLAMLNQRLAQTQLTQSQAAPSTRDTEFSSRRYSSRGYRRWRRYSSNKPLKEKNMNNHFLRGRGQGQGRGQGRGRDGGNKPGSGPAGNCVCPKCGHKEPHVAGQRCLDRTCPKCGTKMTRE